MPSSSPLQSFTLSEQIKDVLLKRITSGELKAGDRLIELKIAEEMQTSQAPVREALRELEAVGIIEIRRNRGAIIRTVNLDELKEVYTIRVALEVLAVEEVVRNAPHLGIKLSALCDRMEASARMKYQGAINALHQEFHQIIVTGSGNQTLIEMWRKLDIHMRMAQYLPHQKGEISHVMLVHRQIVEAISESNAKQAADLLSTHLKDITFIEKV